MASSPPHDPARAALATARSAEAGAIREATQRNRVLGIFGEAEVGKTQTIEQALSPSATRMLRLDLRWAASEEHAGFLLASEMARALVPGLELSRLAYGGKLPAPVQQARVRLVQTLGGGLQEAMRRWPSGRYSWADALKSLKLLSQSQEVLLWVDHIEAPGLSFRHPLKLGALLLSLRELAEQTGSLRLLLSGREAARTEVDDSQAAFSGVGERLSIGPPTARAWREVAELMQASIARAQELATLTDGHPRTMLLALQAIAYEERPDAAEQVLGTLAARDEGLALRAMEHARSLHRLGGQALTQAALGQRPYAGAQRGTTTTQDLSKALKRLRLAGLLRHQDRWSVVNPLLAMRLQAASPPDAPSLVRRPWS